MICSSTKLTSELDKIKEIFLSNGYPEHVVSHVIRSKVDNFSRTKVFGPPRCPIYRKLPWWALASNLWQISSSVTHCFNAANMRIIFSTRSAFRSFRKDVLPTNKQSYVIYHFQFQCDADYVGKTIQRLSVRVAQHVPGCVRRHGTVPISGCSQVQESAIGDHLLDKRSCRDHYSDNTLSIMHRARHRFHLDILEAIIINSRRSSLCRQRQLKHSLQIFGDSWSSAG